MIILSAISDIVNNLPLVIAATAANTIAGGDVYERRRLLANVYGDWRTGDVFAIYKGYEIGGSKCI